MTEQKLITTNKLAEILGVTNQTIYNMAREGMPRIKFGYNTVRYNPEEVMEWLKIRGQRKSKGNE